MTTQSAARPSDDAVWDTATTMCDAFGATVARCPDRVALRTLDGSTSLTWADYATEVEAVARGLHALGVRPGDRVALLLPTSPAFFATDSAAVQLGAVPFSIYATSAPEQIEFLLNDSAPTLLVTDGAGEANLTDGARAAAGRVIVIDEDGSSALARAGRDADVDLEAARRAVQPDDLLTIIYTSGTTGAPKGVQITHRNALSAARGVDAAIGFGVDEASVVSYLPMAHIAERIQSHYLAQLYGFSVTMCDEPRNVVAHLLGVRPSWFFGVPRIFEKLKAHIEASASPEERKVIEQAVAHFEDPSLAAPDAELVGALRERTGLDQVHAANIGAAPAVREVLTFYHALGIPLSELWGMSELCGSGTINPREAIRLGTVGTATLGIEIRIDDDGELQARGEALTPGYRGREDLTREAMTPDGWLRTGDLATMDEDGYVRIVGRKKEIIINASGKNMSPALIEGEIKGASLLVGQAVAVGDARPYNVALIVLDPDGTLAFARDHHLEADSLDELAQHPAVLDAVAAAVERANSRLARVEQIKRYKVLADQWEAGTNELTPTMKLRRPQIAERYAEEIEALYAP